MKVITSLLRIMGAPNIDILQAGHDVTQSLLYKIFKSEFDEEIDDLYHRYSLLPPDVRHINYTRVGGIKGGLESVRLAGVDGRPTMSERGLESVRLAGVDGRPTMSERGLENVRLAGVDGRPTMSERGLESVRLAGVDGRPTMTERAVAGGLENVRLAGVGGRPTMNERQVKGGLGTTFSNLQARMTQMQKKGDFDGNLRRLEDWKGIGTPKHKKNAKSEEEATLRNFRDDNTKKLEKALGDLEEYEPHATVEESGDISRWIALVKDRMKRLADAWKVRTDQEAEKKKK